MSYQSNAGLYLIAFLCILLFQSSVLSQYTYVEGTDTTDASGKGMNGLFTVGTYSITGAALVYGAYGQGYLNCAFDEVYKVPDTIRGSNRSVDNVVGHCFLVCNQLDSTWAKIQVSRQLPDQRFVYRYGKNQTSKNRMLVAPTYDRQRIYRPNNVYWTELYGEYVNGVWVFRMDVTLIWEPPLPCSKPVTGYIVYGTSRSIDTAKPINLQDWQQMGVTTDNLIHYKAGPLYLNVVAVYPGDTSDFSTVLTRMDYPISIGISAKPQSKGKNIYSSTISATVPLTARAGLCTFDGRRVALGDLSGDGWPNIATGVYLRPARVPGGGYKIVAVQQ